MNKTTKNVISLAAAVVLLGGLIGVYLVKDNRIKQENPESTPEPIPSFTLIERDESELERVTVKNGASTVTLAAERSEDLTVWVLADDPGLALDQSQANSMIRGMYSLTAVEKLMEQADDVSSYGLGSEAVTVTGLYADGSEAILHIGKLTPAKDKYYVMKDGDPALYLIYEYYGARFLWNVGELIDRTLPSVSSADVEYIYIAERGKEPIEFGLFDSDGENQAVYEQYGMTYVTMLQPYPGRELYYSNFESNVMAGFEAFELGELVTLKADDLTPYGLNDPSLEIWIKAAGSEMHLLFGDRTDEGQVYCKLFDSPQVFLAAWDGIKSMYEINVFSFIERFVSIVGIDDCTGIDIESPGDSNRNYRIRLEHVVGESEDDESYIAPFVNGQWVQEKAFKAVYRELIGLAYDSEIGLFEPETEPVFTMTYTMTDQPAIEVQYYAYNANFYAVKRDDNPIQFVSNRQSVDRMFQSLEDLLEGKLDQN